MKEWKKPVYKEIGEKMGLESQLDQTIEEVGELLQAIIKLRRTKGVSMKKNMEAWENLHEEIGDVENMVNQLKWHFDGDMIEAYRQKKLKRAIKRVRKL